MSDVGVRDWDEYDVMYEEAPLTEISDNASLDAWADGGTSTVLTFDTLESRSVPGVSSRVESGAGLEGVVAAHAEEDQSRARTHAADVVAPPQRSPARTMSTSSTSQLEMLSHQISLQSAQILQLQGPVSALIVQNSGLRNHIAEQNQRITAKDSDYDDLKTEVKDLKMYISGVDK